MQPHVIPNTDQMAEELALLGHDIRSAIIDVMAGLAVIDDRALDAAGRLQLDRARATTESLVRYLEEGLTTLLAQTPAKPEFSPTDLVRFLRDLTRRWGFSTDAFVITSCDLPAMVQCNRAALDRILSNLISNAITYSGGQTVRLAVTLPSPDTLCFTLTDQGPGFPPNISTALTASRALPAWQSRDGHGLGLGIAHTLAQRIGASLTLQNNPSGGGVAVLSVPVGKVKDAKPSLPKEISYLMGKKVLIADDSMPQLLLLSQLLCDCGAQVTMVRDGPAAEAALETGGFDLALIDIEMPGRTGLEICQALRERPNARGNSTRIVILTAHLQPMVHQAAMAAGASQVLVKPITSAQALAEALCADFAPPPKPAIAAPLDSNDAFAKLLTMAGPEMAAELLARYQEDLQFVRDQLTTALPAFDWQTLRTASHVLIALAGTAGRGTLEQAARRFNLAAQDNSRSAVLAQKDAVLDGLSDLLAYVQHTAQERHA